jgi:hypothetical protein
MTNPYLQEQPPSRTRARRAVNYQSVVGLVCVNLRCVTTTSIRWKASDSIANPSSSTHLNRVIAMWSASEMQVCTCSDNCRCGDSIGGSSRASHRRHSLHRVQPSQRRWQHTGICRRYILVLKGMNLRATLRAMCMSFKAKPVLTSR